MSTGADAKTMPVTAEYEEGHARAFGEHRPQGVPRAVYVMRCSECDGAQHAADAKLYMCPQCRGWTYGSLPVDQAPALASEARSAPIMVDRFMEGSVATDGTDIGTRAKRREYMRRANVADASDYRPGWGQRRLAEKDRVVAESTKRTVADLANIDPRHVRKYIEEKK